MDSTVTAALIGAGAAVIGVGGTVVVAVTSARNSRRTNQATIDTAHADALLTLETAREAQYADRYSRALEQLGSTNLDVRIGGIYALEGIALDSPRHHPTAMEVLTAFIREHSRVLPGTKRPERWPLPDVQAALTVVCRRKIEHDVRPISLLRANLSKANMTAAKLSGASFSAADVGGANFYRADLSLADFELADLRNAYFVGADLTAALLYGASLEGGNFDGANLEGAVWPYDDEAPEGWKVVSTEVKGQTFRQLTRTDTGQVPQ